MKKYIIEDDFHCSTEGEYNTFNEALQELYIRKNLPFNHKLNTCPCTSGENCLKEYVIIEYEVNKGKWEKLSTKNIFTISSEGVNWVYD